MSTTSSSNFLVLVPSLRQEYEKEVQLIPHENGIKRASSYSLEAEMSRIHISRYSKNYRILTLVSISITYLLTFALFPTVSSFAQPQGINLGDFDIVMKQEGRVATNFDSDSFSYSSALKDFHGNPINGANIEQAGNSSVATTSAADGRFTLSGLPTGTPFAMKISKSGYLPTYSRNMMLSGYKNYTDSSRAWIGLYTPLQVTSWGVTPGKGVITGNVKDSITYNNLSGAVVTCTSISGKVYPVIYHDDASFGGNSTFSGGDYYILNVDDGDTITVVALKDGSLLSQR